VKDEKKHGEIHVGILKEDMANLDFKTVNKCK